MRGSRFEPAGWIMFTVSGVVFLAAALRDGDQLIFWGSVTWLVGVGFFLSGYFSGR